MSEQHTFMPEFVGRGFKIASLGTALAVGALTLSGCETVDQGSAVFTCYTVGAEGGGINGPGHTTASGTEPIAGEVAAGNLTSYYKGRVPDYNNDGSISRAERNRRVQESPLILDVDGVGKFRLEDTGGNFGVNDRFDLAMTRASCKIFGKRTIRYALMDYMQTP